MLSISTSHILYFIRKVADAPGLANTLEDGLKANVQVVMNGTKPVTDGISIDSSGLIWMTCLEHSSICVGVPRTMASTDGIPRVQEFQIVNVLQNTSLLRWPDGEGSFLFSFVLSPYGCDAHAVQSRYYRTQLWPRRSLHYRLCPPPQHASEVEECIGTRSFPYTPCAHQAAGESPQHLEYEEEVCTDRCRSLGIRSVIGRSESERYEEL
jgi:hypothetical protein